MISQALLDFIVTQQKANRTRTEIEADLAKSGWAKSDVDGAFVQLSTGKTTAPVPEAKSQKKTWIIIGVAGCGCLLLAVVMFFVFGVAILAAINPAAQMEKAREAAARNGLAGTQNAILRYYAETEKYPDALADLVPDYINVVPTDLDENEFSYTKNPDGKDFELCGKIIADKIEPTCLNSETKELPQSQSATPIVIQ